VPPARPRRPSSRQATSDRPYRRAPGEAFAVEELRRNAGTQFDPEVVAALCRVLDGGGASRADEAALAR